MHASGLRLGHTGGVSTNGDLYDQSAQRVGDVDRQAAVTALGDHWKAGRLDPAEHERRTTAAYQAVTRGDLAALFTDLPGGLPDAAAPSAPSSAQQLQPVAAPTGRLEPDEGGNEGGLVPPGSWFGRNRNAIMGVTPFVALALFFVTKSWIWFLLIPAMGAVLYAGGDQDRRNRRDRYDR